MQILSDLRDLTPNQRNAVLASFLGWTLDAFDFFIIVFVLKDIAKEFKADIPSVTATLFLTLAMRPVGAFLFGIVADRFGRRPTLMIDILFYSVVDLLSGFAPSLTALVILRGLYGIAMGGEWGVGASLTMETIPAKTRGIVSGMLQAGYPSGYLLAAVLYGTCYHFLGWRGMFMVGALPAFLVLFIRKNVEESPAWEQRRGQPSRIGATIRGQWKLFFASKNGTIQTTLAVSFGNNYGLALAITAGIVAIAVAAVTALGPEARGVQFGEGVSISVD